MSSSPPEGFRLRGVVESDIEIAAGIVHAEEEEIRGSSEWGVAETIDFWRHVNPDGGSWIVETDEGAPIAFSATLEREDVTECWSSVHPSFSGRGIASALLRKVELRARERGARRLEVGAFAENDAALRLFDRLGFRAARRYYQMSIDFDTPPDPPDWPEGIVLSEFRREDARAFHTALGKAFAEEGGFHALPFEEWRRTRFEAPETDISLWFLARDGNQIAGVARCDPRKHSGGWIGALGVLKPWRRRGVGLALLRHAFVEFHRRGQTRVGLGVDAENPTGATRLYRKAGMRILTEDIVFGKELA